MAISAIQSCVVWWARILRLVACTSFEAHRLLYHANLGSKAALKGLLGPVSRVKQKKMKKGGLKGGALHRPTHYTLHPKPYALHPSTLYTLHPTPCTLHSAPYPLHPTPYTLHPTPYTTAPGGGPHGGLRTFHQKSTCLEEINFKRFSSVQIWSRI